MIPPQLIIYLSIIITATIGKLKIKGGLND